LKTGRFSKENFIAESNEKCCCIWVFGCTYIRTSRRNRYFEHKGVKSWSPKNLLLF